MWLRNWDNYQLYLLGGYISKYTGTSSWDAYVIDTCSTYGETADPFGDGYLNFKSPTGAIVSASITQLYNPHSSYTTYVNSAWFSHAPMMGNYNICFGDGDESPTYEDYRLSGEVVANGNNLRVLSKKKTWDAEKKAFTIKATIVVTNDTDADITLKELGLCQTKARYTSANYAGSAAYSNTNGNVILMYRALLETPFTVEPEHTETIQIAVDLPMPNHP